MRKLTHLFLSLAVLSVFFTACEPDPVEPDNPTLSLEAGAGFVADGDEVFTEATFQVKINATAGTEDINRIEVKENGTAMDISRLLFDGDPAGSNPSPIAAALGRGLNWVITITASATSETNTYTIVVTDAGGNSGQTTFDVSTVEAAPMLTILDETGFVKGGDSVLTDMAFTMKVSGLKGAADMDRVEVQENGVAVDAARLMINGTAAAENPFSVAASEVESFTYEITVTAPADADQVFTYSVLATDLDGRTGSVAAELTTVQSATPLTEAVEYLLLNQGGPDSTGGLDLHTGISVGSTDQAADIRDQGIDINQPNDQNWIQQIATVNGSDIRLPDAGFSYSELNTQEELIAAFELGTSVSVTDVVQVGDQFLVLSDDTYFALIVTDINITPSDNKDYYEFSVKR